MYTNYIDLIVDGDVVDLNRISMPAGAPIIDERFNDSVPDQSLSQRKESSERKESDSERLNRFLTPC